MYTEYYINNFDEKDIEIKNNIENIIQSTTINNIISINYQAKFIKKKFPNLNVGCFVDYPISNMDQSFRSGIIKDCIDNNIDFIAISVPSYLMINRKYDKIREDILKNLDICQNKELRYILEYRKFDHQILSKICEVLLSCGITIVYPSTGFFLDSLDDNILACTYLHKKTGIRTITNGNAWTNDHIKQIVNSDLYGYSSNNISILKNLKTTTNE